jgi:hypothetical protein
MSYLDPNLTDDERCELSAYGYCPNLATAIVFLVLFGITGLVHLYQAIARPRHLWMLVFFVCAVTEMIGW